MPAAAIIPAAIGVAGAIGAGIAAKNKVGMNETAAQSFDQSKQYNQNAFQYGGQAGIAEMDVGRFQRAALSAQDRLAPTLDYAQAQAARAQQAQMAGLMAARAQGQVPSIAEQQSAADMQRIQQQAAIDMQRAVAAQASQAASARGAAGLALAGQQAASNTANAQGGIAMNLTNAQADISRQAQINAANERLAAEQAAYGAYGGLRGVDVQQAQYGAGLQMQQQQMNDAREQAMLDREQAVRQAQMQAQMQGQGLLAGSFNNAQDLNQARLGNNANKGLQWFQAGMGAATGGAQAAMAGMGGKK